MYLNTVYVDAYTSAYHRHTGTHIFTHARTHTHTHTKAEDAADGPSDQPKTPGGLDNAMSDPLLIPEESTEGQLFSKESTEGQLFSKESTEGQLFSETSTGGQTISSETEAEAGSQPAANSTCLQKFGAALAPVAHEVVAVCKSPVCVLVIAGYSQYTATTAGFAFFGTCVRAVAFVRA